jgi:C1A family cysteine protease
VGYDDARRAFLIRNSWGPGVQERGHFWMPYAVMLDKASAMDFWTLRRD